MNFFEVVSQSCYPLVSLLVPINALVFGGTLTSFGFVVHGVLLVGDYSEIVLSIVPAVVIYVVDYHSFGRIHNPAVHMNYVKAVLDANGVLGIFGFHKVPVVFAELLVIFGVNFGILAGAKPDEPIGLVIAKKPVFEDYGNCGRVEQAGDRDRDGEL